VLVPDSTVFSVRTIQNSRPKRLDLRDEPDRKPDGKAVHPCLPQHGTADALRIDLRTGATRLPSHFTLRLHVSDH
jgi:hypothetical protein